jgi:hypothetical protein
MLGWCNRHLLGIRQPAHGFTQGIGCKANPPPGPRIPGYGSGLYQPLKIQRHIYWMLAEPG